MREREYSMDINAILQKVDEYYSAGQGPEAEKLMLTSIQDAMNEGDDGTLLQLLNEILGYYRETGQVENVNAIAVQCIEQAKRMGLVNTIPYATTLLNVANAYRVVGRLDDSLKLYEEVRAVYECNLSEDHFLIAGLENNMSLLYQEMGLFEESRASLLKALHIVEGMEGAEFELAVTHANLATTCMKLERKDEAFKYACKAIEEFEAMKVEDAHYGAALSALASYYFDEKKYVQARELFEKAMQIMEKVLGRNAYFYRLQENVEACEKALGTGQQDMQEDAPGDVQDAREAVQEDACGDTQEARGKTEKGLDISRAFYETYGRPMIAEKFPAYESLIAVGLVGKGSDCFGYDDESSRDHDWGPDFCMWVTDETYAQIGEALEQAYSELPMEFHGFRRLPELQQRGRRGVFTISGFFKGLVNAEDYEHVDFREVPDYALACVVNGAVFRDDEGIFSAVRAKFLKGYPEPVFYLKLADAVARFAQTGQYNFKRMWKRGDSVTARCMLADCMKEAMKLQLILEGKYPPHDKWLYRSLLDSETGSHVAGLLSELERAMSAELTVHNCAAIEERIEQLATLFMKELYQCNYISDSDTYLDAHSDELFRKAGYARWTNEELVEQIAKVEFTAFDKVQNVGGRASCQNDWATFSIMRKSQYLTWDRTMLLQYLYDFNRELRMGHNLIEEKYGRMMASTAPNEYEEIKGFFPENTPDKLAVIEQIVKLQVAWMEEFAQEYPALADNARSVHTSEDNLYNTSYETYLRGEISTYSDKMLELYGRYVVSYAQAGKNLAYDIMTNSVHLYGYENLDAAERFMEL